jgi:RNA polymerase sigma-70 factor (ECF subfamily)
MDENAVVQVLLRERRRLTAAVTAVLRDVHAADDVFQQVVLDALKSRDQFREPDHLVAWALRAARHRAVDLLRVRRASVLDDAALAALEEHWASLPAGEVPARVEALERCLDRLPQHNREVLRLRYEEGLRCAEVAARLRRTAEAVYQSLSRLHRALRDCIEHELSRAERLPARKAVP